MNKKCDISINKNKHITKKQLIDYLLKHKGAGDYKNELMKLLEKYPDENWDWSFVSRNPNITMEFIEEHPEMN